MRIDTGWAALDAFGIGLGVTANNIANANTDGFRASQTRYETGPGGEGVRVGETRESTTPGPLHEGMGIIEREGRMEQQRVLVEGSNTDTAREMVSMMETQRAHEANVASIRAHDDMTGVVLDIMV